jgi:hypothetical protein
MNQTLKKNGSSVSDSAELPSVFLRNPSPDKGGQKALAVIQDLSWGSFLPLISILSGRPSLLSFWIRRFNVLIKL